MANNNPTAESQMAPLPRQLERKEGKSGFTTRIYPRVTGGLCERCGVVDHNQPSIYQYKLCEHYRGMDLECSYCDPTRNAEEVIRISNLYIYDHPYQRDHVGRPVLGVVCDSFNCQNKFNLEFGK